MPRKLGTTYALLIHFLNAMIVEDLSAPVAEVDILNPYNARETFDDKLTIVVARRLTVCDNPAHCDTAFRRPAEARHARANTTCRVGWITCSGSTSRPFRALYKPALRGFNTWNAHAIRVILAIIHRAIPHRSAMSHDQNFKNMIVDYPRESIAFFAADESHGVDAAVRILPIREEQLQERLGERFRELDIPLLVEWPDGRRAAVLFVFEEETEPRRFSIHRLAHYCLDLAELFDTERVVPVVIFLHPGHYAERLAPGSEQCQYLQFHYLHCALFARRARDSFNSTNLVERLTLPSMAYAPDEKLEVYAQATRGLLQLESDPERRLKYLDFIDIYADLTENERILYNQRYPQEAADMSGFAQRFIDQGIEKGIEQGIETGVQRGEARVLLALLKIRFGDLPDSVRQRVESADAESLLYWSTRVLTAQTLDEVFGDGP